MSQLLSLLQKHPELPPLQHLMPALSAAVSAAVAAGDASFVEAAEQLMADHDSNYAGSGDITQLYWAAVAGAAQMQPSKQPLLQYWIKAVSRLPSGQTTSSSAMTAAAEVVVAAMATDAANKEDLIPQLLAQPLPNSVLMALLRAVVQQMQTPAAGSSQVLQLLLAYAVQQDQLKMLPAKLLSELLPAALSVAAAPADDVAFAGCLQLLQLLLQDGAVIEQAATEQLVAAISSSTAKLQQFEDVVLQHASTHAAFAMLCSLLHQASASADLEISWNLFLLLQQCRPPSADTVQQQLMTACSSLLVQLDSTGTAAAADRAVQVWQYCCATSASADSALQQLSPSAQAAVVSALVAAEQHEQALAVMQDTPQLLPHLAAQWQQQAQPVDGTLLLQALQLCVSTADKSAATAADSIICLLLQWGTCAALQGSQLAAQVVQLLCSYDQITAALKLLPACVSGTEHKLSAQAATAVAAAAAAITKNGTAEQQQEMLQLLVGSGQQQLLHAAVSQCLVQAAPGAVGLLLGALHISSQGQNTTALLQPQQLGQLCDLVCAESGLSSNAVNGSSSSSSASVLPTVEQLARDCAAVPQLPGAAAALLLNTLCKDHPELQPSAAAAAVGVTTADTTSSSAAAAQAGAADLASVERSVCTVAALCFNQVAAHSGLAEDLDSLDAALSDWASQLSPQAAAAALLAAGLNLVQPGLLPAADATAAPAAVPVLCHILYTRAKATGDSLVFDLGLAAAAAAEAAACNGNWGTGEGIIAAAEKALQHAADGSKGSRHKYDWVPLLPAARSALLSVLVHTGGVEAAGRLLLAWKEHGGSQGQGHVVGRRSRAAGSSSSREAAGSTTAHTLLSLSLINRFLAEAVSVASAYEQEGADEEGMAAAQAALEVANDLFKQQLVIIFVGAAGSVDIAAALPAGGPASSTAAAADTFASLAQLYGAVGDWQQVSRIVAAAVKQQLVGVQADGLQVVLAGTAAVLNAAGKHVVAVQLLDGLLAAGGTAVVHPALAEQLLAAANEDDALQELSKRLASGEEDIFEGLPELAAAAAASPGEPCVGNTVLLNQRHQPMPLQQLVAEIAGKQ